MDYKYIEHCKEYFGYGQINDMIVADSLSWEEDEEIILDSVIEYTNSNCNKKNIYFITTKTCQYPLSTFDKHFGLWYEIKNKYNMRLNDVFERNVDFNRYCILFGIAKIYL